MARNRISDFLQDHAFWAFDASFPLVAPVFTPLFGFSRISAPSISLEIDSFKEGTFVYNRNVVKGASVGAVTFERGASFFDSDFYDWIAMASRGTRDGIFGELENEANAGIAAKTTASDAGYADFFVPGIRRNLVIVHFSKYNPSTGVSTALIAGLGAAAGSLNTMGAATLAGISGTDTGSLGPFEFAARIPARAWLLHSCIPTEYRSGSDFDASSSSVSIMSLTVQPEWVEEFSFGLRP